MIYSLWDIAIGNIIVESTSETEMAMFIRTFLAAHGDGVSSDLDLSVDNDDEMHHASFSGSDLIAWSEQVLSGVAEPEHVSASDVDHVRSA